MASNNLGNTNIYTVLTEDGLSLAYQYLDSFFDNPTQLELAFGNNYNQGVASELFRAFAQGIFSEIPEIKILSDEILGDTNGAYSAQKNEIYLNESFLEENAQQPQEVVAVLIEEIGHFIDAQINTVDSAGDEGNIFSRLVLGEELSAETLEQLKAEDDSKTIILDGEEIAIEQNKDKTEGDTRYTLVQKEGNLEAYKFQVGDQVSYRVVDLEQGYSIYLKQKPEFDENGRLKLDGFTAKTFAHSSPNNDPTNSTYTVGNNDLKETYYSPDNSTLASNQSSLIFDPKYASGLTRQNYLLSKPRELFLGSGYQAKFLDETMHSTIGQLVDNQVIIVPGKNARLDTQTLHQDLTKYGVTDNHMHVCRCFLEGGEEYNFQYSLNNEEKQIANSANQEIVRKTISNIQARTDLEADNLDFADSLNQVDFAGDFHRANPYDKSFLIGEGNWRYNSTQTYEIQVDGVNNLLAVSEDFNGSLQNKLNTLSTDQQKQAFIDNYTKALEKQRKVSDHLPVVSEISDGINTIKTGVFNIQTLGSNARGDEEIKAITDTIMTSGADIMTILEIMGKSNPYQYLDNKLANIATERQENSRQQSEDILYKLAADKLDIQFAETPDATKLHEFLKKTDNYKNQRRGKTFRNLADNSETREGLVKYLEIEQKRDLGIILTEEETNFKNTNQKVAKALQNRWMNTQISNYKESLKIYQTKGDFQNAVIEQLKKETEEIKQFRQDKLNQDGIYPSDKEVLLYYNNDFQEIKRGSLNLTDEANIANDFKQFVAGKMSSNSLTEQDVYQFRTEKFGNTPDQQTKDSTLYKMLGDYADKVKDVTTTGLGNNDNPGITQLDRILSELNSQDPNSEWAVAYPKDTNNKPKYTGTGFAARETTATFYKQKKQGAEYIKLESTEILTNVEAGRKPVLFNFKINNKSIPIVGFHPKSPSDKAKNKAEWQSLIDVLRTKGSQAVISSDTNLQFTDVNSFLELGVNLKEIVPEDIKLQILYDYFDQNNINSLNLVQKNILLDTLFDIKLNSTDSNNQNIFDQKLWGQNLLSELDNKLKHNGVTQLSQDFIDGVNKFSQDLETDQGLWGKVEKYYLAAESTHTSLKQPKSFASYLSNKVFGQKISVNELSKNLVNAVRENPDNVDLTEVQKNILGKLLGVDQSSSDFPRKIAELRNDDGRYGVFLEKVEKIRSLATIENIDIRETTNLDDLIKRLSDWDDITKEGLQGFRNAVESNGTEVKTITRLAPQSIYIGLANPELSPDSPNNIQPKKESVGLGLAYLSMLAKDSNQSLKSKLLDGLLTHGHILARDGEGAGISEQEAQQSSDFENLLASVEESPLENADQPNSLLKIGQQNATLSDIIADLSTRQGNTYLQLVTPNHSMVLAKKHIWGGIPGRGRPEESYFFYDPNFGEVEVSVENPDVDVAAALKQKIEAHLDQTSSQGNWTGKLGTDLYGANVFDTYELNIDNIENNSVVNRLEEFLAADEFKTERERLDSKNTVTIDGVDISYQTLYDMGAMVDGKPLDATVNLNNVDTREKIVFDPIRLNDYLQQRDSDSNPEDAVKVLRKRLEQVPDNPNALLAGADIKSTNQALNTLSLIGDLVNVNKNNISINSELWTKLPRVSPSSKGEQNSRLQSIANNIDRTTNGVGYVQSAISIKNYFQNRNNSGLTPEERAQMDLNFAIEIGGIGLEVGTELGTMAGQSLAKNWARSTSKTGKLARNIGKGLSKAGAVVGVLSAGFDIFGAYDAFSQLSSTDDPDQRQDLIVNGSLAVTSAATGIATAVAVALTTNPYTALVGAVVGAAIALGGQIYNAVRQVQDIQDYIELTPVEKFASGWRLFWGGSIPQHIQDRLEEAQANEARNTYREEYTKLFREWAEGLMDPYNPEGLYHSGVREVFYSNGGTIDVVRNHNTGLFEPTNPGETNDRVFADTLSYTAGSLEYEYFFSSFSPEVRGVRRLPAHPDDISYFKMGRGDDTIQGRLNNKNTFIIEEGKKNVTGGKKDDTLVLFESFSKNQSQYSGGEGTDTIVLSGETHGTVYLDGRKSTAKSRAGSSAGFKVNGFENVIGNPSYGDQLHGTDGDNYLNGAGGGQDRLYGYDGDDVLEMYLNTEGHGGKGHDTFRIMRDAGSHGELSIYDEQGETATIVLDYTMEEILSQATRIVNQKGVGVSLTLNNTSGQGTFYDPKQTTVLLQDLFNSANKEYKGSLFNFYTKDGFLLIPQFLKNLDDWDDFDGRFVARYIPEAHQGIEDRIHKDNRDIRFGFNLKENLVSAYDPDNDTLLFEHNLSNHMILVGEGTEFHDTIIGDEADNLIRGYAGNDFFVGGAGSDTYLIDKTDTGFKEISNPDDALTQDFLVFNVPRHDIGLEVFGDHVILFYKPDRESVAQIQLSLFRKDEVFRHISLIDVDGAVYELGVDNDNNPYLSEEGVIGGTDEKDELTAATGSPTWVFGDGGDDTLNAASHGDVLDGGDGNDTLYDTFSRFTNADKRTIHNVTFYGGDGNDTFYIESGDDVIFTGNGADKVSFSRPFTAPPTGIKVIDTFSTDGQLDTIEVRFDPYNEAVSYLRDGNNLVVQSPHIYPFAPDNPSSSNLSLVFLDYYTDLNRRNFQLKYGNDTLSREEIWQRAHFKPATDSDDDILLFPEHYSAIGVQQLEFKALAGDDLIRDWQDNSGFNLHFIHGDEGDDTIFGEAGRDRLYGHEGNDKLYGGEDIDHLYGGEGNDHLIDFEGDNTLDGGLGDDLLEGQGILFGGLGSDVIIGSDEDDELYANNSNDTVGGENDTDLLSGLGGDDYLVGSAGEDIIDGGMGDDILTGGDGDDTIIGGMGSDILTGGDGVDTFQYDFNQDLTSLDTIRDFDLDEDVIIIDYQDAQVDMNKFGYNINTGVLWYDYLFVVLGSHGGDYEHNNNLLQYIVDDRENQRIVIKKPVPTAIDWTDTDNDQTQYTNSNELEEIHWLVNENQYLSYQSESEIPEIQNFYPDQDFIGIDHNQISDIKSVKDLSTGSDPDPSNTLILRERTFIKPTEGEFNGQFIPRPNLTNKKIKNRYGNNVPITVTEILMGGTGDTTTINDNDVLVQLIGVSSDQLLDNSRTSITGETYISNFVGMGDLMKAKTHTWELENPTLEQYDNKQRVSTSYRESVDAVSESDEIIYQLISNSQYGDAGSRTGDQILRIDGFNPTQDFIGIDHNGIDSKDDILLGGQVTAGTDPDDTLILRQKTLIDPSNNKFGDGLIEVPIVRHRKMKNRYGNNYQRVEVTEILMGGTGDTTTINDNDVLAQFINVSPNELLDNSRTSVMGMTHESNFVF